MPNGVSLLLRPDLLAGRLAEEARGLVWRGLNETVLRVGITGLSRAGKTVFLTSLLSNLLALAQGHDTLPGLTRRLSPDGRARFSVRIVPAGSERVPRFDYADKFAALARGAPEWPPRTDDMAAVAVELSLPRAGALASRLGPRVVRLEFLDYPGEWLLDLPLLGQDFASWSAATLARLQAPARADIADPFLRFVRAFDPAAAADHALIERGHRLYKDVLTRLRGERGFRYLQPGRFLNPGSASDAPYLWFFPARPAARIGGSGGNAALLEQRYDAYREESRTRFFETRFLDFDRQIVLVDVLSALHAGQAAFEDTRAAIADIASTYAYGSNTLVRLLRDLGGRMLGATGLLRQIERVTFAATKADHVPAARRPDLVALLRAMAGEVEGFAGAAGRGIDYRAAAGIRATRDDTVRIGDRATDVVVGVPAADRPGARAAAARPFFAGDIPAGLPPPGYWAHPYFELPRFLPPRIDPSGARGIDHIGLDDVLLSVIGDRL